MTEIDEKSVVNRPNAVGAGPSPWPIRLLAVIVQILLFSMMALTFVDVVGRYIFNAPVPGAAEYIEFLLGLLIFSAFPLVTWHREHITVSLFERFFRGRVRWFQQLFILVGSAMVIAFITDCMWSQATGMVEAQLISTFLKAPIAPFVFVFSGLSLIAFLVLLVLVWEHLKGGIRVREEAPPTGYQKDESAAQ